MNLEKLYAITHGLKYRSKINASYEKMKDEGLIQE